MLKAERPARRGWTLGLALLLCGALGVLHRQSVRPGGPDPAIGVARDMALVPGQTMSVRVGRWWHDTVTASFQGPTLARRNRALQAQVHVLLAQNKDLVGAQIENGRLRRLLRFQKKSPVPLLAAEVLAIDPSPLADTLILGRGRADGVRPRTVVLAPNGALVGQVVDASAHSCSVLLLTDAGSSVGAQVVRRAAAPVLPYAPANAAPALGANAASGPAVPSAEATNALPPKTLLPKGGPIGICQGAHGGLLALTYLPVDADVRAGDLVTTSGLGGVFPKGVTIGIVDSVVVDKTRSVKSARLRPAADLDHLEEAFLRLKPRLAAAPVGTDAGAAPQDTP